MVKLSFFQSRVMKVKLKTSNTDWKTENQDSFYFILYFIEI